MDNKKGNATDFFIDFGIIMVVGLIIFLVVALTVVNFFHIMIINDMEDYCKDNGYDNVVNQRFSNNFVCVGTKKIPNETGYETRRSNIIKYEDIKNGR